MTPAQSNLARTLVQVGGVRVSEILKNKRKYSTLANFSPATIYRHSKKPLTGDHKHDGREWNRGRPRKLTATDRRQIRRQIVILRRDSGTFSSSQLQESSGLLEGCSNSTFRRQLRTLGYRYRRSQKKGLLLMKDLKTRRKWASKAIRDKLGKPFFRFDISMYLDAAGFEYRRNPFEHSRAPRAREWRKRNEGLNFGCTAKGSTEGKTQVKFMVGMSYGCGVVLCERITTRLTGHTFARMIRRKFPAALASSSNPQAGRILQDGDPAQNSAKAMRAFDKIGATIFKIPPRSPDLNPIENLFHQVKRVLFKDARSRFITKETSDEFALRVESTLRQFSSQRIDRLIDSMPARCVEVRQKRGLRIRY